MEKLGDEPVERQQMDLETSALVDEVSLEGLHLDTDVIYRHHVPSKKRKPEESLDEQDPNSSNENNELCEEILKRRKREDPIYMQGSMALKRHTDDLDLMCKIWVMELRRLPLDQQLFARKAVCDVLFEARLGQLNKDSVRINRSDVVQNYLTCVHEESGKICACPDSQDRCPSSPLQLYPWHSQCYPKGTWKGNLSSPHRPPFLATYSNRFPAPSTMSWGSQHHRGPRIGRPVVITTAVNITTTTFVVVTPRLISTKAPSASVNCQVVSTVTPSKINTVNLSCGPCNLQTDQPIESPPATTFNPTPDQTTSESVNGGADGRTSSSISPNNNNDSDISDFEHIVRIQQSTKPTVNSSTTPTVYTLCDVHMETVTTEN